MRTVLLLLVLGVLVAGCTTASPSPATTSPAQTSAPATPTPVTPPDASRATYVINSRAVTLINGKAEEPAAPGSATKVVTTLTSHQAVGDVTSDGKPDAAVIITQNPGGSGTFYYVAAVLNDGTAQGRPTNLELLGDRISVESVRVTGGEIVVDYLTRGSAEPMASPPTVKATKKLAVKEGQLIVLP